MTLYTYARGGSSAAINLPVHPEDRYDLAHISYHRRVTVLARYRGIRRRISSYFFATRRITPREQYKD